ncbi:MAG: hypothetical protein HC778_00750 [Chamaesiphon sp. CSU_1_12]|nr:hypothetical protein [Chamaesiphon sp. CSU_1_12]
MLTEFTSDPRFKTLKKISIEIGAQTLLLARAGMVSGYERNPNAIIEIKNQAEERCEPASSSNNDRSLFKPKKVNIYGDKKK